MLDFSRVRQNYALRQRVGGTTLARSAVRSKGQRDRDLRGLRRQNLLLCVVPLVALTIYGHQLFRVSEFSLSRWKGGGMGMFSSISSPRNRIIKAYFLVNGVRRPIAISGSREVVAFKAEPTESNSKKLKGALSGMQRPILQSISPAKLERNGRAAIHPEGIHLELWQFSYERGTATVRTVKIWDDAQ